MIVGRAHSEKQGRLVRPDDGGPIGHPISAALERAGVAAESLRFTERL